MKLFDRGTKEEVKIGSKLHTHYGQEVELTGVNLEDQIIYVSFFKGKDIKSRKCRPHVCNLEFVDPRFRMTEKGKKCCDLYWLYSSGKITREEMDKRREELESKQINLPMEEQDVH
jgi:hypothetical protein